MSRQHWEDASEISGNLFNPAFLSEIMRLYARAFLKESKKEIFSFETTIIIMPFVLDHRLRASLPKTKRTKLHEWIQNHGHLVASYPDKLLSILPFIREAIVFGVNHQTITLDEDGFFRLLRTRKPKYWKEILPETENIFAAATFLGRWSHTFPETSTTFTLLGIKP